MSVYAAGKFGKDYNTINLSHVWWLLENGYDEKYEKKRYADSKTERCLCADE